MFEGFRHEKVELGEAVINLRVGGAGPALLLLHGFPQTHVHWHAVAPQLKQYFTLVMPDLRGYGESIGPGPDAAHRNYSKRAMGQDMFALMERMGYPQFRLAGHDRGARVAYRMTLDCPSRITHLASLDTVPTIDIWEAMDMTSAIDAFHWPFLAQPAPIPERLIGNDPDFFLHHLLDRWAGSPAALDVAAVSAYAQQFRKPSVLEAMAEDYRAGATIDLAHDREDREAGKKILCPVLALRGTRHTADPLLPIWKRWACDVREIDMDCGHFIAEENPEACAVALQDFLLITRSSKTTDPGDDF
jgi:haloacetate dehalogenase